MFLREFNSYPFGMHQPNRQFVVGSIYRYGFNGKENDNEVKGDGNQQDYGMRIYDSRLGRFLSVDPWTKSYPMLTPYQYASNRPIDGIDLDGLEYLPNGESLFSLQFGEVYIKTSNVPSVYKDAIGQPRFNALGVGIDARGKIESPTNYQTFQSTGFNSIPASPTWTFGSNDMDKDIYGHSEGTKASFNKGSGWSTTPFKLKYQGIGRGVYGLSKGADVVSEITNYFQMYKDQRYWRASIYLHGGIKTFDKVVKEVDTWLSIPGGIPETPGYKRGLVNRDNLINFVLDGSLPSRTTISDILSVNSQIQDLQIMYYGMQIIHANRDVSNSGAKPHWLTSSDSHVTSVSNETIDRYDTLIKNIEARNIVVPKEYKELSEKIKKEK